MITTSEVTGFVTSAELAPENVDVAAREVALFAQAAQAGAGAGAPAALRRIAPAEDDPVWAAWITGAAAITAPGSPSRVAVCAAAAALGGTPAATAAGAAVGYEIAGRVAAGLAGRVTAGWCPEVIADAIGAGAAAGRVLRLSEAQVRHTIGLCATQATGVAGVEGTDTGALQVGKAAANAVEAALLSRCGFTSSQQPLEGRRGLFAVMSGQQPGSP